MSSTSIRKTLDAVQPDRDNIRLHIRRRIGGKRMATNVDLDALITREDFEVIGEGDEAPVKGDIQVSDLESNAFFFGALRKPDFQRETLEWDAKRIVGLIRSFINDELIPGVILWKNDTYVSESITRTSSKRNLLAFRYST
jgi:hypothetical protein